MTTETHRTSGLAIASLVLSSLSVVLWPFGCVPGVICGHLAKREVRCDPAVRGEGLATAGLIVGYVFLALTILLGLAALFMAPSIPQVQPIHAPVEIH